VSFRTGKVDSIPGSYVLKHLKLFSQTGTGVDLDHLFLEFSIFEDLFAGNISGALTLAESFNIVSNLPIVEGDIIQIYATVNYKDPTMIAVDDIKSELKMDFEIIKITDRATIKQDMSVVTLILATSGWSDNTFQRVSRSFNQKKYSEMAQLIFDENFQVGGLLDFVRDSSFYSGSTGPAFTEPKGIFVEPTDGLYNIVIPSWQPIKVLNFLANRATNGKEVSDWLFFEDPELFRFVSINSLFAKGPIGDHFTQISNIKDGDLLDKRIYQNFHSLQYSDSGNILEAAKNGMFSNNMLVYDIYSKVLTEYRSLSLPDADNYVVEKDFNYIENFDMKEHCDKGKIPLTKELTAFKYATDPGRAKKTFLLDHPLMFDEQKLGYEFEKFSRQRTSQKEALQYYKLTATGPGLFSRKIGDVINLELATPEINSSGKTDTRLKGNYLISALRRVFTPDNHSMTLELVKDNYFSEASNPLWNQGLEAPMSPRPPLSPGGGM